MTWEDLDHGRDDDRQINRRLTGLRFRLAGKALLMIISADPAVFRNCPEDEHGPVFPTVLGSAAFLTSERY